MFPDEPESVDDGAKWPFQIIIKNKKISRSYSNINVNRGRLRN
jgi:hypothetical protein